MKEDHENKRSFFRLPEHIFHAFKTHTRRKTLTANNSFTFIVENEWYRKESILQNEIESITKRLYGLSNISNFYGNLIQSSINPNLKDYLSYPQLCKYNKCLEYIKRNILPNHYAYYVIDFFMSTGKKFLHLSEDDIFLNIANRMLSNIRASYSGVITPKPKETLYNSLPRAFSPLFFEQLQFSGIMFRNKSIRKDFEECLILGFAEQLKNSNHKLLQYNNYSDINCLVRETLAHIEKLWWVPENLIAKFKQVKLYVQNLFPNDSHMIEYLAFNYISHSTNYGADAEKIKNVNPSRVLLDTLKHLKPDRKSRNNLRKGWSLVDSTPSEDQYIYSVLEKAYKDLNRVLKPNKKLVLSQKIFFKKAYLSQYDNSNCYIA